MEKAIEVAGNIAGVLGILTCLVSGMYRFVGEYTVSNVISVESMFTLGIGLMVGACLAKLQLLWLRK